MQIRVRSVPFPPDQPRPVPMTQSARAALAAAATIVGIVLAACSSASSTEPNVLNLRPGTPSGWSVVGTNSPSYVVGLDNVTLHGGHASLAFAGTDTSPLRFTGVGQFIRADTY